MDNQLYRSKKDRIIAGVCGGLAEHYKIHPSVIRILFVILVFFNGFGILLYIMLAILLPEGGKNEIK